MKNEIKLLRVQYLPIELESGILYVSVEFNVAGHLCPCGCGNKIITPLGPTEWSYKETNGKPSLYPSMGNWQLPCRSHYWVKKGKIVWSYQWSEKQIITGRQAEEERRKAYFNNPELKYKKYPSFTSVVKWLFRK